MTARTLPLLCLAAALGCSGTIGDTVDGASTNGVGVCGPSTRVEDTAPLRRLSQSELGQTLTSLAGELGVSSVTLGASPFPNPTVGDFFSNNNRQNSMSQYTTAQLMDAAERFSDQLTADLDTLVGCSATPSADACMTGFINRFGRLAFQRPLQEQEVTAFKTAYEAIAAADSIRSGVRAIIELGVQSPDFVYITVTAKADDDGRMRFDGHSVARRLSYFLWGTMPDATLRAAADANALTNAAEVRIQAERMLDDDRARDTIRRFHREWLAIKDAGDLKKNTTIFPKWSDALADDAEREFDAFVDDVVWTQGGSIGQLLTDRSASVNARLADFYGVQSASTGNDDWQPATLPENRRGIVTRAAYLASNGTETGTSPIKRGVAILSKLMCTTLTAPANVDITLPAPDPASGPQTKKQIFAAHTGKPACAACHTQIDPYGFAFEIYDATGAVETVYPDGQSVDATGKLPDGRTFTSATDLLDQLATDPNVASCYSQRWLEWSVGRSATAAEKCEIAKLATTGGTSVREALVQLATSDLMLYELEQP